MYLSKIMLYGKMIRNPYDIHRGLWQLFPNRPNDNRDFLFRIEKLWKNLRAEVLMQSAHKPADGSSVSQVVATRPYRLSLMKGQRLRFRLRANPTKKIRDERGRLDQNGNVKKCRVPLIQEGEQKDWLERKSNPFCVIETLLVNRELPLYFRKGKDARTGKIQTVLYDGILRVRDPVELVEALEKGIGPAKVFGCGLLSIAPA